MCGIVGYVGHRPAMEVLIGGLKRLEYRGYDSAGVAYFRGKTLEIIKSEGKLENVEKLLGSPLSNYSDVHVGIGHTRWATHGRPTTQNAHPHRVGHIALVHNGIIENYQEIKKDLASRGQHPVSETDSELFGFLVLEEMEEGKKFAEAVRCAFSKLEGSCSVVVMSEREPGMVIGVRNGSPLVVARDPKGGVFFASDAQPILEATQDVIFLENGDVAIGTLNGTHEGLEILDLLTGKPVKRSSTHLEWSVEKMDKQGYAHYMLKEIHEQPSAMIDTLNGLLDRAKTNPFPMAGNHALKLIENSSELTLIACGSSWHAALLGKYWLEKWAKIPVQVELASEYRYADPIFQPKSLVIGISQSGETADTLAVIRDLKKKKIPTLGITNVRGSTISREADGVLYTSAGPEIGVAATKSFQTQMLSLFLLAGYLAKHRQGETEAIKALFDGIIKVPHLLSTALMDIEEIRTAARTLSNSRGFFFIGRGNSFPMALEGALKLKEIAYIHAEGYAGGELKHGPIAMIDEKMTVVVIAPRDRWHDKTASNLEEVKARGARILCIGNPSDTALKSLSHSWISLPEEVSGLDEGLLPFFIAPILQLFSYELALLAGTDVDKPRNLAKSVTVE